MQRDRCQALRISVEHEPRGDVAVNRIKAMQPSLVLGLQSCKEARPSCAGPTVAASRAAATRSS
jgi:hypothetical protein